MNDSKLVNNPEWAAVVKGLIRSEMTLRNVTYKQMSARLNSEFGTQQSARNLNSKINKGVLGAQLFLQILIVLDANSLDLRKTLNLYHESIKKQSF